MNSIKKVQGREILDSRGNPTVEAEVWLESGLRAHACVPSGASTGSREAIERRDGNERYHGKGVLNAVESINTEIHEALTGMNVVEQSSLDKTLIELDGTHNKNRLGANALLAVSLACAKVGALSQNKPFYRYLATLTQQSSFSLPVPMLNIINGGAHADNNVDIQEFMVLPIGAPDFQEGLRYGVEIYHALKSLLKAKGYATSVGDEGGFAPNFPSNLAALEFIMQAIEKAGFGPGKEIFLSLDVAANELYQESKYVLASENLHLDTEKWIDYLENWVKQFPIISIEDAMEESDWAGWCQLTKKLGQKVQLVGDDLFVTNTALLQEGITKQAANAILIKLNQIGTLTETLQAISLAKENDFGIVISHRSGETEDTTIADLSVATGVGQIKTGAPCRTDRVAKYNQLLRIAQSAALPYAGTSAYKRWL